MSEADRKHPFGFAIDDELWSLLSRLARDILRAALDTKKEPRP